MSVPNPTPIYRMVHIDNLDTILRRGGMHGTNHVPNDGLPYRTIHNVEVQNKRHVRPIQKGPGGTMHDYVPFYFGYLSPMLLQLHTGRVDGFTDKQPSLVYLVSTVQHVAYDDLEWVFSNGHGIAAYTEWFDDLDDLDKVDWDMVYQRYWSDNTNDMDRQRRKQAEFMIHRFCPWAVIEEIGVVNVWAKNRAEGILGQFGQEFQRPVRLKPDWYY